MPSDFFPRDESDESPREGMNESELQDALVNLLASIACGATDEATEIVEDLVESITSVRSFRAAGVLTRDAGFVLTLSSGAEFQVTMVRSR